MSNVRDIDRKEIEHRFGFHKGTDVTGPIHKEVRANFKEFVDHLVKLTPPGREQSLMLTALQEASMWANAAVAMQAPLVDE